MAQMSPGLQPKPPTPTGEVFADLPRPMRRLPAYKPAEHMLITLEEMDPRVPASRYVGFRDWVLSNDGTKYVATQHGSRLRQGELVIAIKALVAIADRLGIDWRTP